MLAKGSFSKIMLHMEQISYRYLTRRLHLTTTVATPKMVNVNYSPVISPSISSPQSVSSDQTPLVHRLSATSVKSLADLFVGRSASSASSIQLNTEDVQVVTEEGLRHSSTVLEAR